MLQTVRVRVGPTLQQAVGRVYVTLEVSPGLTPKGLRSAVAQQYPELALLLGSTLVVAEGRVLGETEVVTQDEVALLHPVAGG
ncbi:MAG: MoaD/ThiS family protein [Meiothermus sp.]|nr:MoaD/ThiS family protein [Meiothermus sp.]